MSNPSWYENTDQQQQQHPTKAGNDVLPKQVVTTKAGNDVLPKQVVTTKTGNDAEQRLVVMSIYSWK